MTERERSCRAGSQRADVARERACRLLHTVSEQKKRAQEAPRGNALVQSWPEIVRLGADRPSAQAAQARSFTNTKEST